MDKVFIRELARKVKCASAFELLTSPNWAHVVRDVQIYHEDEPIHLPIAPIDPDDVWFTCWEPFEYVECKLTRTMADKLTISLDAYHKILGLQDTDDDEPYEDITIKKKNTDLPLTVAVIALCTLSLASIWYKTDSFKPKK